MPAGGLFSTAADVARFCRMLLNGGELDGKRVLSAKAVQTMTSNQVGELLNKGKGENGYGFGLQASRNLNGDQPGSGGAFGHGGAYATNMHIDPARGLIFVYMVQHAGYANKEGKEISPAFEKAAAEKFGKQ